MAATENKTKKRKVAIALTTVLVGSLIFGAGIVGVKSFSDYNNFFIETEIPYPSPSPSPSPIPSPNQVPEPIHGPSPI